MSAHKHIYNSKRWKTLRERLLKARDYRCDECGWATSSRDLHADHVHELSDGRAPFDPDNIRFLCRKCHSSM